MLVIDNEEPTPEDTSPGTNTIVTPIMNTEDHFLSISTAALFGLASPKALRITGHIQNWPVSILIDSGSMVKNKREKNKIETKPDQIKKKREAWKSPLVSKANHSQNIRKKKKIQSPETKSDKP
nr:hypothetical protein [Tanacetum cinerariifolium]